MSQETEHSREVFDRAQREYDDAITSMDAEISKARSRRLNQFPYRDLPSQEKYYEAAQRKYSLLDQAHNEAHFLEEKHKRLIDLLHKAQRDLIEFEKTELGLHQDE